MKTFIVPTDFSETSKNAARFAAQAISQVPDAQVILYNVFDKIETGTDGSVMFNDHESRKKIMELALLSVKTDMLALAPDLSVTCIAEEEGSFITSLERLARHHQADLIIMGITGASRLEQVLMGSSTLSIVNRKVCPVLIVPPHASFTGVKNIMFASDFKEVEKTVPATEIRSVLQLFNPFVHVVNVDHEHYVEVSDAYKAGKAALDKMLEGFDREYYFIRLYDFMDAINQFVADHKIDLILSVPKAHSFFAQVFKSSYTKKLIYHSHVPIIAVHE